MRRMSLMVEWVTCLSYEGSNFYDISKEVTFWFYDGINSEYGGVEWTTVKMLSVVEVIGNAMVKAWH